MGKLARIVSRVINSVIAGSLFMAVAVPAVIAPGIVVTASAETAVKTADEVKQRILQNLQSRNENFTITYKGDTAALLKSLNNLMKQAMNADDYVIYIVKSSSMSASYSNESATIKYSVKYWESAKQTDAVNKKVKEALGTIMKPGMNNHQKVKAIHDWIVTHVAYDTTLRSYSAYEGLTNGKTVCQGYSLLGYKMLTEAGIKTRIAEGTVKTGAHAWNLVELDGKWYHLDLTWDDPVPDEKGRTTYNYYLLTDKEMKRDHAWTESYPAATSAYNDTVAELKKKDKANAEFYEKLENELGYSFLKAENKVASVKQLTERVNMAIGNGEKILKIRYLHGDTLRDDMKQLLKAIPSIASFSYTYSRFTKGDSDKDVIVEMTIRLSS